MCALTWSKLVWGQNCKRDKRGQFCILFC